MPLLEIQLIRRSLQSRRWKVSSHRIAVNFERRVATILESQVSGASLDCRAKTGAATLPPERNVPKRVAHS
jgi:hypothetical protein